MSPIENESYVHCIRAAPPLHSSSYSSIRPLLFLSSTLLSLTQPQSSQFTHQNPNASRVSIIVIAEQDPNTDIKKASNTLLTYKVFFAIQMEDMSLSSMGFIPKHQGILISVTL